MSFSSPSAFAWALLALPIVIFYILKVRMRRVPVSTTMFWQKVFEEKTPRSFWQQLRHLSSLLLQLALLSLLVLALADPYLENDIKNQRRIVLVLDASASMNSSSSYGESAFDTGVRRVADIVESLRGRDELAIVVAGARVSVACGLTSHPPTLLNRLATVTPTDAPTTFKDALDSADLLLADHPNGQIVAVTDGRFPLSQSSVVRKNVRWEIVGDDRPNIGITRLQIRRSLVDPLAFEVLIRITNFSDQIRTCKLDLLFDDVPLDVYPIELQPQETWQKVIQQRSTGGGVITAELRFEDSDGGDSLSDALDVDNRAFAILPRQEKIPVELITKGNWFLERVLAANDALDVTVRSPDETDENSRRDDERPPIRIYDEDVPETIPSGSAFVVHPKRSTNLWEVDGELKEPLVGKQASAHELMKNVQLDNVLIPAARKINFNAPVKALAESVDGDPLYACFSRPEGDVVVLTVDLNEGDLPLRTAFPILLINAINAFSDGRGVLMESIATGDIAEVKLPQSFRDKSPMRRPRLEGPNGEITYPAVSEGRAIIGPLPNAGVWTLTSDSESPERQQPSLKIASNLMDPDEGRLKRQIDEAIAEASIDVTATARPPIWYFLTLAGIVVLLVEWYLFQRRWIH